ncbi:cGMP-dependent 3',5'-cyclic phosphodiesterase-like [Penaeus monodon]|uniref:cGMP-dependent 3',5'-cyclic phosphodiesterase-like n=1 Tax=Penaeus monodon TaxID=6687 RepID=UPI0018A702DB|nr:cGMP-dependent 3',5'-cyclic phosphodiesterase-like [Penaeus monodon]
MVRKGYRDPPYHNWLHAFSVTHFAFLLLYNLRLMEINALTHLEGLALIVSSMCHDLDHRGTTNSFQIQSTDLAHHLRLVSELREVADTGYDGRNPRHHELLICLLMTAADLSDQTKDWQSSKHVAELIYKEFFTQGDLEKAMGNMPLEMMDREKAFIPELQLQFLDDVAIPVYELLAKMFPGASDPYHNIQASRKNWAKLRDVYKRRKPESTSSLDIFEDDSLEEDLAKEL